MRHANAVNLIRLRASGEVLGIANMHPAELQVSDSELAEHRNVIMTLIYRALPSVRGVRPRRVTAPHYISERVMYHLFEKELDRVCVKVRHHGRTPFKVYSIKGGIPQLTKLLRANDAKWAEKRFGVNARTFIFDAQGTIGGVGTGGEVRMLFSMHSFKVGGERRNAEVLEQGRLRVSFVYSSDGIQEASEDPEEQARREAELSAEMGREDALLLEYLGN